MEKKRSKNRDRLSRNGRCWTLLAVVLCFVVSVTVLTRFELIAAQAIPSEPGPVGPGSGDTGLDSVRPVQDEKMVNVRARVLAPTRRSDKPLSINFSAEILTCECNRLEWPRVLFFVFY